MRSGYVTFFLGGRMCNDAMGKQRIAFFRVKDDCCLSWAAQVG
jgi:hypothetical protein